MGYAQYSNESGAECPKQAWPMMREMAARKL